MNVQKRIRELRNERGWTDYRLAKEANLSHSTVTNNNAPTLPTLKAVCNIDIVDAALARLMLLDGITLNEETLQRQREEMIYWVFKKILKPRK